ncbi:MAG: hypothetical protein DMF61_07335 [Blastocatellia bacterium AA13]|nr:MAG: hypothetical protein DMF61_07335 [Blastocatellia bacterium AA13]
MNETGKIATSGSAAALTDIEIWSIGIYSGATLSNLEPALCAKPVLGANDVDDVRALFVADPFMLKVEGTWHMFFEVLLAESEKGEIGWATSDDGLSWTYRKVVLREPFHLSYPYVFCVDGQFYMIPESIKSRAVRLYKADRFPDKWSFAGNILEGLWADPSVFFFEGRWWMFACHASPKNDQLALFHAEDIFGPWRPHALNPIVDGDNRIARPAGRVVVRDDRVIRFAQDCNPNYGTSIRALEISELTQSAFSEKEIENSPILRGGDQSWNLLGMHNVDPHWIGDRWLACVDGWRFEPR